MYYSNYRARQGTSVHGVSEMIQTGQGFQNLLIEKLEKQKKMKELDPLEGLRKSMNPRMGEGLSLTSKKQTGPNA